MNARSHGVFFAKPSQAKPSQAKPFFELLLLSHACAQAQDGVNWANLNRTFEVVSGIHQQNYREQDGYGLTPDGTLKPKLANKAPLVLRCAGKLLAAGLPSWQPSAKAALLTTAATCNTATAASPPTTPAPATSPAKPVFSSATP